jgi:hypothetical protein
MKVKFLTGVASEKFTYDEGQIVDANGVNDDFINECVTLGRAEVLDVEKPAKKKTK